MNHDDLLSFAARVAEDVLDDGLETLLGDDGSANFARAADRWRRRSLRETPTG